MTFQNLSQTLASLCRGNSSSPVCKCGEREGEREGGREGGREEGREGGERERGSRCLPVPRVILYRFLRHAFVVQHPYSALGGDASDSVFPLFLPLSRRLSLLSSVAYGLCSTHRISQAESLSSIYGLAELFLVIKDDKGPSRDRRGWQTSDSLYR